MESWTIPWTYYGLCYGVPMDYTMDILWTT